jgi:acyl-CoA thioesterase FadM
LVLQVFTLHQVGLPLVLSSVETTSNRMSVPLAAGAMIGVAVAVVASSVDVEYFTRAGWMTLTLPKASDVNQNLTQHRLLRWHVTKDRVTTRDLDTMGHMNNSRYSWKGDMARFHLILSSGIRGAARALGAEFVIGAITQRFRRELAWREEFEVYARFVGWDERSFFVEHVFVKRRKSGGGKASSPSASGNPDTDLGSAESDRAAAQLRERIAAVGAVLAGATDLEVASVLIAQMFLVPTTPGGRAPTPAAVMRQAGCEVPVVVQPPEDITAWGDSVRQASARLIPARAKPVASKL